MHLYKESQLSEWLEPTGWWGVRKSEGFGKQEAGPGGSGQTINGLVCPYFGLCLVGGGDQSIALLGRDSLIGTVHKKQLREHVKNSWAKFMRLNLIVMNVNSSFQKSTVLPPERCDL